MRKLLNVNYYVCLERYQLHKQAILRLGWPVDVCRRKKLPIRMKHGTFVTLFLPSKSKGGSCRVQSTKAVTCQDHLPTEALNFVQERSSP